MVADPLVKCLLPASGVSGKLYLDREADSMFSLSHMPPPGFGDLHNRLKTTGNSVVSHMADASTKIRCTRRHFRSRDSW